MTARVNAAGSRSQTARPSASSHSKKLRVADQPVFDDLAITGAHLAPRQCRQARRIGQHEPRLVEGADKVFPRRRVDRGLAADRAVDLSQQRGRDLHEIDPAQQRRGGKPGDVADHATAQRDQHRAPLDADGEHVVDQLPEMGQILCAFARREHDRVVRDAVLVKAPAQRREVMTRDLLVGDNDRLPSPQQRQHRRAGALDQAGANENVVASLRERDAQALRRGPDLRLSWLSLHIGGPRHRADSSRARR